MKNTTLTIICSLLLASICGAQPAELWTFDDPADTPINLAANTGTSGNLQFDQKATTEGPPTGGFTDGSGLFVISGPSSQSFRSAIIGGYEGLLTTEFVISGWDLDDKDIVQAQSFRSFGVRIRDGVAEVNIIHFQLNQQGSGNVRIRYSWDGEGNWTVLADALDQVSSTDYTVNITLDKTTGAFVINLNGAEVGSGIAAGAAGVDTFNVYSQGPYKAEPYGPTDFVKLDSLSLDATVVPEPSVTWAGYDVDELGYADTTPWLGYVNVLADPWIWSVSLNKWIYMPESSVTEGGSWGYVLGQ